MIVSVVIICHNQDHIVNLNIAHLCGLSSGYVTKVFPNHIIVVHDRSELTSMLTESVYTDKNAEVKIHYYDTKECGVFGRAAARNIGIGKALDFNSDVVIFMDGDTIPTHNSFVGIHSSWYEKYNNARMVFGLRNMVHKISYGNITIFSTDAEAKEETDPRLTSEVYPRFNNLADFDERANFIMTGWVTWTCNFSINRKALDAIWNMHNKGYWFDESFKDWGFEDNAFGLDALYAGVDINIDNMVTVNHLIHKSEYTQLKQILGSSMIFNRFRKLECNYKCQL